MSTYLDTAITAANLGAGVLLDKLTAKMQRQVSSKQEFDFVTDVDLLSERRILSYIRDRHPDHTILSEESGSDGGDSAFQWIIDPLDGTTNYIHGFPAFAVSVALRRERDILVGVIADPLRQEIFYAEKGRGAFLNDVPILVSEEAHFGRSLLATGFPFRAKHLTNAYFQAFISMFHEVSDLRRAGSAALDLAYVACGRLDGFWEIGLNAWDIAAGCLLVSEAGGQVSDIFGQPHHLETGHIVASNRHIHQFILDHSATAFVDLLH